MYYNASNRVTKTVPPEGGANGYVMTYDAYGQVISRTNPSGQIATLGYSDTGRVTKRKDELNNETTYAYDLHCNMTRTTNPLSQNTDYEYADQGCGGCGSGGRLTKNRVQSRLAPFVRSLGTAPDFSGMSAADRE